MPGSLLCASLHDLQPTQEMDFIAHGFNFFGNDAPFDVEAKQSLIQMVLLLARIPGKEAPTLGARRKDKASIAPGCTLP